MNFNNDFVFFISDTISKQLQKIAKLSSYKKAYGENKNDILNTHYANVPLIIENDFLIFGYIFSFEVPWYYFNPKTGTIIESYKYVDKLQDFETRFIGDINVNIFMDVSYMQASNLKIDFSFLDGLQKSLSTKVHISPPSGKSKISKIDPSDSMQIVGELFNLKRQLDQEVRVAITEDINQNLTKYLEKYSFGKIEPYLNKTIKDMFIF